MRAVVAGLLAAVVAPFAGVFSVGDAVAAPPGDDEVIAFVARGVGNGHGRGMSQWGAFGRAVAGDHWGDILDDYYGGTESANRSEPHMRVRLTDWDGAGTLGVISRSGAARWNDSPTDYTSLYATETSTNVFSVFGVTSGLGCPGALDLTIPFVDLQQGSTGQVVVHMQEFLEYFGFDVQFVDGEFGPLTHAAVEDFQDSEGLTVDGLWRIEEATAAQALVDEQGGTVSWQELATDVAGPIRFSTTVDQSTADADEVLGLCESSGAVTHYRGGIELIDVSGTNRVVSDVDLENYVRGVVPKEVPPSWGSAAGGAGMNSLRAQAVAARSFGMSQSRYSYAGTCDTTSCQVYAGSAIRVSPTTANYILVEHALTDQAIVETAGTIRVWPGSGDVVSTEFSASNGPRTAGGAFPPVDDPWDDVPGNPNHTWTRIIDADSVASRYGLSSANGVSTALDADSPFDGIWANEVVLGEGKSPVSAWDFRNAFNLPAPGYELIPVTRSISNAVDFAFVGDSVGVSVAGLDTSEFPVVTEGNFSQTSYDVLGGRRTQGGASNDGVVAASNVPIGTDIVLVELGYNDTPTAMPDRIDAVMNELRTRSVGLVIWVTVSERLSYYAPANVAIRDAAERWGEMIVVDWHAASDHTVADRWYADDVHLTSTGQAEFALWLREVVLAIASDGYTPPRPVVPGYPLRVPVLGFGGVPESGVVGVALNVTSVGPVGPGFLRVWACGSDEPETSSVNFVAAGSVEPNAVVVPVDGSGEVCVSSLVATDVLVDVTGWFDSGVRAAAGRLVDTRDGERVESGEVLRVPVLGFGGVPESGVVGVALNVTSVGPVGPGFLRVWACGSDEPETSSVNFVAAGSVEPNAVVVPVDGSGEVCVSSLVATDVLVDVTGWFDSGVRAAAGRLVDTRDGERVESGEVLRVPVLGFGGVPDSGVVGVALNVTSVGPVGPGFLRVWACGSDEPETSSVNFVAAGSVEPNAVVVPVDGSGEVCVSSLVATDVLVDVTGWFDSGLKGSEGERIVDTRIGLGPIPPR